MSTFVHARGAELTHPSHARRVTLNTLRQATRPYLPNRTRPLPATLPPPYPRDLPITSTQIPGPAVLSRQCQSSSLNGRREARTLLNRLKAPEQRILHIRGRRNTAAAQMVLFGLLPLRYRPASSSLNGFSILSTEHRDTATVTGDILCLRRYSAMELGPFTDKSVRENVVSFQARVIRTEE
ncbi:hypothetical protein BV25DRAFT_1843417, partial [Artomyces pyxidatus]